MKTNQSVDLHRVEECAVQVVNLIQQCIHAIRSVPELKTPSVKGRESKNVMVCIKSVKLYNELESQGLVRELENIQELVHWTTGSENNLEKTDTTATTERFLIVHRVMLPLVKCLFCCYEILDQELPPAATPKRATSSRRSKRQPPPAPPRGMLSIQNYTDIAALLEFLVCTSILPNLQPNILTPVQDRIKHALPKSLAGRIPFRSLLWGCSAAVTEKGVSLSRRVAELQQTAQALGRLVLLDRFRPMLLPRHLVDVYAAMFQADALLSQNSHSVTSTPQCFVEYQKFQQSLLGLSTHDKEESQKKGKLAVDAYSHARACQALLLRGTKAPAWLRQRVSVLLTDLACRDLAVIVQVFVQEGSSSREHVTAASMRLATALTANNAGGNDENQQRRYYGLLCRELLGLLDIPMNTDPRNDAGVAAVWAVLEQLSHHQIVEYLLPLLCNGLIPKYQEQTTDESRVETTGSNEEFLVHKTVRRIGTLLSGIPSTSTNPDNLGRLFLHSVQCSLDVQWRSYQDGVSMTLFVQLLRISCLHSVLETRVKKDALECLGLLVEIICRSKFQPTKPKGNGQIKGTDVMAMALIHSVAPTAWDLNGYQYQIQSSGNEQPALDPICVVHSTQDLRGVVPHDVEQRSKLIISLVSKLHQSDLGNEDAGGSTKGRMEVVSLPSRLFNSLLRAYFSSTQDSNKEVSQVPAAFCGNPSILTLATMTLLPLLCEECSPQSLLQCDGKENDCGGSDVLSLIKLILDCTSSTFGGDVLLEEESERHHHDTVPPPSGVSASSTIDSVFEEILGLDSEVQKSDLTGGDQSEIVCFSGNDMLLSLSSLVLSILIALLELGSEQRTQAEEAILLSIVPSLQSLSNCTELQRSSVDGGDSDTSLRVASAELAEMASHSIALISSRTLSRVPAESQPPSQSTASKRLSFEDVFKQAEQDLQSEQVPFRARGVVALRHLARGYLSEKEETVNGASAHNHKPLIQEIDESGSGYHGSSFDYTLERILKLSIASLKDTESYVYLAGVQTIVALADVCPRKVLPVLGRGVCTGAVSFAKIPKNETEEENQLTQSQRVKLTEALVFTIRRRGSAIYEFVCYLMDFMIFGCKETGSLSRTQEHKKGLGALMQRETHNYFLRGNFRGEVSKDDPEADNNDREVRMRTGGPVFDVEEDDLIRAACISVLAELVSVSHPAVVAGYAPHLVKLATNALQLDASRPVRRSAALLSRALYDALLREHDGTMEMLEKNEGRGNSISLVVEMQSSGEDVMFSVLLRCVEGSDVEVEIATRPANGRKMRFFDQSTVYRCQEAVNIRRLLENEGVFAAAKLVASSFDCEDEVSRIVRERLRGRKFQRDDPVSRRELTIDSNSLKLA